MDYKNILSALSTQCHFAEAFKDTELPEGSSIPVPRRKIGHVRADYDGYRWWNTVWPCHPALSTPEIAKEIDTVYDALTAKTGFSDLDALRSFCLRHMDTCVSSEFADEFNFYLSGERCDYWLRLITRRGDYNLYLHAFARANPMQKYFDYLEALRESGATNMYGATTYLQEEFPELKYEPKSAKEILLAWMASFKGGDRGC